MSLKAARAFALCAACAAILAFFPENALSQAETLSLFSMSPADRHTEDCSEDPLQLSKAQSYVAAVKELEVNSAVISLQGCRVAPLMTTASYGATEDSVEFTIFYPLGLAPDEYAAPLVHELAHVRQIVDAGDLGTLRELDLTRIELGADYLAGLVASRTQTLALDKYQLSVRLLGSYRELGAQSHGNPGQRTNSFRLGYFVDTVAETKGKSRSDAYNHFQTRQIHSLFH